MGKYNRLFERTRIANMTLPNRFVMAPMTTGLGQPDGQLGGVGRDDIGNIGNGNAAFGGCAHIHAVVAGAVIGNDFQFFPGADDNFGQLAAGDNGVGSGDVRAELFLCKGLERRGDD